MSEGSRALRAQAVELVRAALRGADARSSVVRHLGILDGELRVGPLSRPLRHIRHLVLLGAGKAAGTMARAAEDVLGDRLRGGLVLVPERVPVRPRRVRSWSAGHPLPDAAGLAGTQELLRLASGLDAQDHALIVLSGGASALLAAPAGELTLDDLRGATEVLLRSGCDIHDFNTVRRHLSAVTGGWLAAILHPCPSWTLVLSDVVGDDLSTVGSGPTLPDPTTFGHALAVVDRYDLGLQLPVAVLRHLQRGAEGLVEETPKPGNPWFNIATVGLAGGVAHALDTAERAAIDHGYDVEVLSAHLQGEAADVGAELARAAIALQRKITAPTCWLYGGETTVTWTRAGRGGRNQELALSAAIELDGHDGILLFALATDGVDGPTDAAGATADGGTVERMRQAGVDARQALADHDSHPALDAAGDLLRTGPTGTNVMDVIGLLVRPV